MFLVSITTSSCRKTEIEPIPVKNIKSSNTVPLTTAKLIIDKTSATTEEGITVSLIASSSNLIKSVKLEDILSESGTTVIIKDSAVAGTKQFSYSFIYKTENPGFHRIKVIVIDIKNKICLDEHSLTIEPAPFNWDRTGVRWL
jgi:hypothetical protein